MKFLGSPMRLSRRLRIVVWLAPEGIHRPSEGRTSCGLPWGARTSLLRCPGFGVHPIRITIILSFRTQPLKFLAQEGVLRRRGRRAALRRHRRQLHLQAPRRPRFQREPRPVSSKACLFVFAQPLAVSFVRGELVQNNETVQKTSPGNVLLENVM